MDLAAFLLVLYSYTHMGESLVLYVRNPYGESFGRGIIHAYIYLLGVAS